MNNILRVLGQFKTVIILSFTMLMVTFFWYLTPEWFSLDTLIERDLFRIVIVNINVLLIIAVGYLLLRALVKLYLDKKNKAFGIRLKTRMAVSFIVAGFIPILIMFTVSKGFLRSNLDFWFKSQFRFATEENAKLRESYIKDVKEAMEEQMIFFRSEHSDKIPDGEVLQKFLGFSGLTGIRVSDAAGEVLLLEHRITEAVTEETLNKHWEDASLINLDEGFAIVEGKNFLSLVYRMRPIVAGVDHIDFMKLINKSDGSLLAGFESVKSTLDRMGSLKPVIDDSFNTYLWLLTLMLFFGLIWMGVYLSKNITIPIDNLIASIKRIQEGDFEVHLERYHKDEVGALTDAFNRMVLELKTRRNELIKNEKEISLVNQRLNSQKSFTEKVLEYIQIGVVTYNERGYLISVNSWIMKHFGLKPLNFSNTHYRSIFPPDLGEEIEQAEKHLILNKKQNFSKDIYADVENTQRHYELQIFPIQHVASDYRGRCVILVDITDIDKLSRAKAWQEVARRMAHEIKNPLTPIQLSAQRLKRKYETVLEDNETLIKCTDSIVREVENLKTVVNEFADFARIPELNASLNDLPKLVEETLEIYRQVADKRFDLTFESEPDLPKLMLDKAQMRRVVNNLANNAIKSMREGGKLAVKVSRNLKENMLELTIRDSGAGISPDHRNKIFEPYFTTSAKGTGLGLAIVKRIVTDHDGRIEYFPNKDAGSTFKVSLPIGG